MTLKQHYDKILHVTCTFMMLAFLTSFRLPGELVFGIVLMAQVIKTGWNFRRDVFYRWIGDWCANAGGYLSFGLYHYLQGLGM